MKEASGEVGKSRSRGASLQFPGGEKGMKSGQRRGEEEDARLRSV